MLRYRMYIAMFVEIQYVDSYVCWGCCMYIASVCWGTLCT